MKVRLITLVAVLALAGVACSSGTKTPSSTSSTPTQTAGNAVTVAGIQFVPATLNITAGSKVTWTWSGSIPHNVVADDGSFTSGAANASGTFEHTFATAGTFTYVCEVHKPGMKGTIVVA